MGKHTPRLGGQHALDPPSLVGGLHPPNPLQRVDSQCMWCVSINQSIFLQTWHISNKAMVTATISQNCLSAIHLEHVPPTLGKASNVPKSQKEMKTPRQIETSSKSTVAPSSASQLRLNLRCRLLRWSGESAQTYRFCTRHDNTQRHSTQNHRRGRNGSQESHTHEQLSCRRQNSPISMYYRFGERARITTRPQIKYARFQSTTSPQICVTF